jgi:hypothetical protein
MHGETCYCLLVDHFSGMLFGQWFRSKAPPLEFLQQWLSTYGLSCTIPDRYVRFDLGGELGRCADVIQLSPMPVTSLKQQPPTHPIKMDQANVPIEQ